MKKLFYLSLLILMAFAGLRDRYSFAPRFRVAQN
jgi:hypothetical protein